MSATAVGSSITGSTKSPAASEIEPISVVSAILVATPAMVSPSCRTIEIVTFKDTTEEISKPNATPHIVDAERLLLLLNESRFVTERDTMSAVSAGSPDD